MRKILVFVFLLFAGTFFCRASSDTLSPLISYKHFGEEEGLKCKFVYEAVQDKNGFIWFSTDAGVFRYDGRTFKRYTTDDGIGDNEVLKICQDHYGRIWFLALNGKLSFWKDGRIYNSDNTAFLKNSYTGGSNISWYEDTRGRLWIGTDRFGFIVIVGDSVAKIKFPASSLGGISYVHEDINGQIRTFWYNKMFRYPEDKFGDTVTLENGVMNYSACHKKNSIDFFYFAPGKIYKIHDSIVTLYIDAPEIKPFERIINITSDRDYVWICTAGKGCFEFVNGKFSKRYFEKTTVTFVFKDRENNLWFNTIGEGIYMISADNDYVTNYSNASGLGSNNITSVAARNNEIWLGFTNGETTKVEGNRITTFKLSKTGKPVFNRVTCFLPDANNMLCGTDNGIFAVNDNHKIEFVYYKKLTGGQVGYAVKQLFMDSHKNIFIGHADGFEKLTRKSTDYSFEKFPFNFQTRTFSVTEYLNRVLLATRIGLLEYAHGQEPVEFKTDINTSIRILDMKPDNDSLLLLATDGRGLYILKDRNLYQHITTANGLSDNNCKRIFIAGESVYVSTNNGINILTKENGYWNVSAIISTKNGLISNNINEVILSNRKIYAATEKGLSVVDPAVAYRDKFVGKVYVTEIITDTVSTVTDSSYSFKADISRLLIRFSYPVFNPANDLTVKYRMLQSEADNAEWISSENHEVEFSSLSPGQYIFQLKPETSSASGAGISSLYINIIPLWWQTNAARVALALLVTGLIALAIRARFRMQYKKKLRQLAMLEAERSRIASDMHDDIGADLTQISIWSNILEASKNKDTNVLSRIIKSSNEVLQKMEQIIWALNSFHSQTTDLISYLREYASQYLESAGINLSFEIPVTMPELQVSAIQKRNIFLTVKELLHNTVKHSGAKNVSIAIYVNESVLNIEYKDDGKGFTAREKEDGMGNITVQKRMKEIHSTISVQSAEGQGFSAHLKIKLDKRLTEKLI